MGRKTNLCIEQAREQLHDLVEIHQNEFQHPDVIKQSMLLDELINQYYRVEKEIEKPIF